MSQRSTYTHKKYPKRIYESWYRYSTGEREFILSTIVKGQVHNISFESVQAAKNLGWTKHGRRKQMVFEPTKLQEYKNKIKKIKDLMKKGG